jgi:hypothetical protein
MNAKNLAKSPPPLPSPLEGEGEGEGESQKIAFTIIGGRFAEV